MKTIGESLDSLNNFAINTNASDTVIHFSEYDSRIKVEFVTETGVWKGTLEEVNPIICCRLPVEAAKPILPRVLQIYQKISARIGVQRFYGVLEKGGARYSVMEDLTNSKTLAEHIKEDKTHTLLQRLGWAYQIASTMAYLHGVGIVLKALSDESIVIHDVGGTLRPVLTELELARLVTTDSSLAYV